MSTVTPLSTEAVARWLALHPAPIHTRTLPQWQDEVRSELGGSSLDALVELLADGDPEQQYQAMAAARTLGAEVFAEGSETQMTWKIKLPKQRRFRRIVPRRQLPG